MYQCQCNLYYKSLQPGVAAQPGQGQGRQLGQGSCVCTIFIKIIQASSLAWLLNQGRGSAGSWGGGPACVFHKRAASDTMRGKGGSRVQGQGRQLGRSPACVFTNRLRQT